MSKERAIATPGGEEKPVEAPRVVAAADAGGDLPNAIDVDAKAITAPVLTRQGWICPDEVWQKSNPAEFAALRKRKA